MSITIDQIRQAADAIPGHIIDTPCLHLRTLSKVMGAHVFLKFENYQFTASFKERSALNKRRGLDERLKSSAFKPSVSRPCTARSEEPATFGVSTIADGIAVKSPGMLTLPIIKREVSDILLVDEGDIEQAIAMLLRSKRR